MLSIFKFSGVWILVFLLGCCSAVAERYLSVAEVQRLCFPSAEKFDGDVIRFAPKQKKELEKKAGVPVRNAGNQFWVARSGTNLLGVLMVDFVMGKHELIDYAVAIAPDGKILQVEILEYRESHGGQIRGTKWRNQFQGKSVSSPFRLNEDIYNISGATISCRHVTEGVRRVLATYDLFVRPRLVADKLPDAATEP